MEDFARFLQLLHAIPLQPSLLPEYRTALAIRRVIGGEAPSTVAKESGHSIGAFTAKVEAVRTRGLAGLIPDLAVRLERTEWRRQGIAQMLLGDLTEQRFEQLLIPAISRGQDFSVERRVEERSDTDFLIKDPAGHPLCRLNIKFHGTLFRQAQDIVGLEPTDCFALATYKIYAALQRQERDRFPYVFLVLSIPGLSAASIAAAIPDEYVWLLAAVKGRRIVEEAIARMLSGPEHAYRFQGVLSRIQESEFRVISARRAFNLMLRPDLLFQRVFALRVPRFNQNYRNAELDMHFSITAELTPVEIFIDLLATNSLQTLAIRLDRGEM